MPDRIDYVVDPLLTNLSVGYKNNALIADQLFPRLTVESEKGFYYTFNKVDQFTVEKDLRTGIARANRVGWNMSKASYGPLIEHSLESGISKEDKRILGEETARRKATELVTNKILLRHEIDVNAKLKDTAIITQTQTLSGTSQFSDYTNSDPIGKVATAVDTIKATAIAGGNRIVLVMGYQVWRILRNHTKLVSRLGNAAMITLLSKQQVAQLLEVDDIIVAEGFQNTAAEGQAGSLSYIWGKDLWVMSLAGQPSLESVNPGYTLQLAEARQMDSWSEPEVKADFVRFTDFFEPKVVAPESVFYYKDAVA